VVFGDTDFKATFTVLTVLREDIDESPWADYYGKPLSDIGLAKILRKYKIKPKYCRVGTGTARGYLKADFKDACARYLSIPPPKAATSATSATDGGQT